MEKRKQRSYTAQYRVDAVALAQEIGRKQRSGKAVTHSGRHVVYMGSACKEWEFAFIVVNPDPKVSLDLA